MGNPKPTPVLTGESPSLYGDGYRDGESLNKNVGIGTGRTLVSDPGPDADIYVGLGV